MCHRETWILKLLVSLKILNCKYSKQVNYGQLLCIQKFRIHLLIKSTYCLIMLKKIKNKKYMIFVKNTSQLFLDKTKNSLCYFYVFIVKTNQVLKYIHYQKNIPGFYFRIQFLNNLLGLLRYKYCEIVSRRALQLTNVCIHFLSLIKAKNYHENLENT